MLKKEIVFGVIAGTAVALGLVTYLKKSPNLDSYESVTSSWLSDTEKTQAVERIVTLVCDKHFKDGFVEGTTVVGENLTLQESYGTYSLFRDVIVVNAAMHYQGKYICEFYKDGRNPILNVTMPNDAGRILKAFRE